MKRILIVWLLGVGVRSLMIALAEDLIEFWRWAVPLSNCALAFALQLRKSMENVSQDNRAVKRLFLAPTWLSLQGQPRLACRSSVHLCYPGDFSQPSVGTSSFQLAEQGGSPLQLSSSRNSRPVVPSGRRKMKKGPGTAFMRLLFGQISFFFLSCWPEERFCLIAVPCITFHDHRGRSGLSQGPHFFTN
jgi:hypothetical protein